MKKIMICSFFLVIILWQVINCTADSPVVSITAKERQFPEWLHGVVRFTIFGRSEGSSESIMNKYIISIDLDNNMITTERIWDSSYLIEQDKQSPPLLVYGISEQNSQGRFASDGLWAINADENGHYNVSQVSWGRTMPLGSNVRYYLYKDLYVCSNVVANGIERFYVSDDKHVTYIDIVYPGGNFEPLYLMKSSLLHDNGLNLLWILDNADGPSNILLNGKVLQKQRVYLSISGLMPMELGITASNVCWFDNTHFLYADEYEDRKSMFRAGVQIVDEGYRPNASEYVANETTNLMIYDITDETFHEWRTEYNTPIITNTEMVQIGATQKIARFGFEGMQMDPFGKCLVTKGQYEYYDYTTAKLDKIEYLRFINLQTGEEFRLQLFPLSWNECLNDETFIVLYHDQILAKEYIVETYYQQYGITDDGIEIYPFSDCYEWSDWGAYVPTQKCGQIRLFWSER